MGPHIPAQCPTEPKSPAIHITASQGKAWGWLNHDSINAHLGDIIAANAARSIGCPLRPEERHCMLEHRSGTQ
jgi:hypothetical protein